MRWLPAIVLAVVACNPQAPPSPIACRLPVVETIVERDAFTPNGFLTVPGAQFTESPEYGAWYDRTLGRWIPARPPAVSVDGRSYAREVRGDLHYVSGPASNDRVIASGGPFTVVGVTADGVYVLRDDLYGLWKLPLHGGSLSQVAGDPSDWKWVDANFAYAAGKTVDRLDLRTGKRTTWFGPNVQSDLLAVDTQGNGFVVTGGAVPELWRVTPAGIATRIWSATVQGVEPTGDVAVDGTTVWFSSLDSSRIYRYSPADGFKTMLTFADRGVAVAGTCL